MRSKKHLFYKKTILPDTWYHVLYHPPPTAAVVFVPIVFPNMLRFACFGITKCLTQNIISFFVYCFPEKSMATTRNCRLFGPRAVRAVVVACRCVCTCFWGCHEYHEGVRFRSSGGNDGHAGVIHKFSRVAGAYPPNM